VIVFGFCQCVFVVQCGDGPVALWANDIKRSIGVLSVRILCISSSSHGRPFLSEFREGDLSQFCTWSRNQSTLENRHLEPGQRAMASIKAKPLLAAEAKKNLSAAGTAPERSKNASPKNGKGVLTGADHYCGLELESVEVSFTPDSLATRKSAHS
jgi:hypothetical protein